MTTYATLDGDRVAGVYMQDTDEGIPAPFVEIPDRLNWPPRPSPEHETHWVNGAITWVDPRTTEQKAAQARERRDAELAACDWMVTRAVETEVPMPPDWKAYRAALRAIPQQPGFPESIAWPVMPTT